MKKILKGLVKYVTLTVLLVCFLPLSLHHVKADEVEYSLLPMLVIFQFMMMVMRHLLRK